MDPVLAQRYVELQNLGTTIASADELLAAKKFENAVSAYQVAGSQASQLIATLNGGPSITISQQLQALQSHLASETTATQAAGLAKQLQSIAANAYNTASAGAIPTPTPSVTATAPQSSPVASAASTTLWIAVISGVGAILYLTLTDPKHR